MSTPSDAPPPAGFAPRLAPPYYAVIFTSQRTTADAAGYGDMADRMVALAAQQPGYLGAESARGADGLGLTVSYWRSEADIAAWRREWAHSAARDTGRARWYAHYELRVARVERAYGWDAADDGPADPMAPAAPPPRERDLTGATGMDARWGAVLALAAVLLGAWRWGWPGAVLGGTLVVFWLLMQFNRSLRVLQRAGRAPVGTVASAVMLHSRLQAGMTLMQILPLAGSLGRQARDGAETFTWQDAGGDAVRVVLLGGRLSDWQLVRAQGQGGPGEAQDGGPAVPG